MRKSGKKNMSHSHILLVFPKIHLLCFFQKQKQATIQRSGPWESLCIISCHILLLKQECIHTHIHSSCTAGQRGITDEQRPLKGGLSVVLIAGLCLDQTGAEYLNQGAPVLTGHCKSTSCSNECVVGQYSPL